MNHALRQIVTVFLCGVLFAAVACSGGDGSPAGVESARHIAQALHRH